MGSEAVRRGLVSGLSYVVRHPAGVETTAWCCGKIPELGSVLESGPYCSLPPETVYSPHCFPPHNPHPVSQFTGMGWEPESSQARGSLQVREAGAGPPVLGGGGPGEEGTQGPMKPTWVLGKRRGQGGVQLSLSLFLSLPSPGKGPEPSKAR